MKKNLLMVLAVAALLSCVGMPASAQIPPYPELAFPVDFEAKMARVIYLFENDLSFLADLLGDDAALVYGFAPDVADANGAWNEVEDLPGPNGLLDKYELGLLAQMANNPGVYGADIQNALIANYQALYTSCLIGECGPNEGGLHELINGTLPFLWGSIPGLIDWDPETQGPWPSWTEMGPVVNEVFQALALLIAGYATIGDEDTMEVVLMVAGLLGFCDILAPGQCLVQLIPPQTADGYIVNPGILGPEGNADTDDYTNRDEYNWFVNSEGYGVPAYADAALDPDQTPPDVLTLVGPAKNKVPIGTDVLFTVTVNMGTPVGYQWYLNGALLEDETGNTLELPNAQVSDSGTYRVDVTVDAKATSIYSASYTLTVTEYVIPVGGAMGLIMLSSACALAGIAGLRRRK